MMLLLWACSSPDPAETGDGPDTENAENTETAEPGDASPSVYAELVEGLETVVRVRWDQPAAGTVWVDYTGADGAAASTPARSVEAGEVEQIVLGATYDDTLVFEVMQEGVDPPLYTGEIATGARPEGLPTGTLLADEPSLQDETMPFLLTSMNREGHTRYGLWWVFVMDRAGRVIWAQETPETWISRHVSVTLDGQAMLVDRDTLWVDFDNGYGSTIVRMTLDGTVEHTYETRGLHHSFVPLPDKGVAWMAKTDDQYEELHSVTFDGKERTLWDCEQLHDRTGASGSCGTNGLFWDEQTGHFLMSAYSTDTVAEIDPDAGEVVRWFGDMSGAYAFDPEESQFWWQHGPTWTDERTLMVSTKNEEYGDETLVREYTVDEKTSTLTEIWSFGEGRGVYGQYMGEAHRLPSGNTLHVYGAGGHMAEATHDGEVAWEMTWKGDQHNGHTTPLTHEQLYALLGDPEG